jgi:pSer/pThr/pTyr-binding forkhead associated (FHA) protein
MAAAVVPPEVLRITGGDATKSLSWGALVSLQRDGSDGERHALAGEWMEVGRDLGDIRFPDDRFLARQHARIERTDSGARIAPLDQLNGVYRRVFDPVQLVDGAQLLLGREVMRFELVDDDERDAAPLVRHGVALFGSPPRTPWGRLSQLLASGGVRDIRYLTNELIILGREEGDIVFRDDAFLSRRHASFAWTGSACMLDDLDSSNGSFLRLTESTVISAGEQLRMGDQVFRFEYLA